ncbi:NUDIX hydrolase [Clostridium sp. Marseille-P2415]|uniref:NUDIX hydrolase n=1 Tax=Clostridium sp. Marseille-P2415 TaxID=1805471 RepID=UPI0009888655|nr:NUDIX domain-containing protein [Clostridium sp. Marseille-P2415]
MVKITFYDSVEDHLLHFAVIVSRYQNKWIFCRHKDRSTFECPGGHREKEEDIITAARRELYEETGAAEYTLKPVCAYSVQDLDKNKGNSEESFGMLFYSEVKKLGEIPPGFEIETIQLFDETPDSLTYPEIQPVLMARAIRSMS